MRQPVGGLIDAQGITADLEDDDLVDGAIVLLLVRHGSGSTSEHLLYANVERVARRGLIERARDVIIREDQQ